MNRLHVSARILLGFGAVLLLLAAIGGAGVLGLGRTLGLLAAYHSGAELTVAVMQAQNELETGLRAARQAATTGSPADRAALAAADQRLAATLAQVDQLIQATDGAGTLSPHIAALRVAKADYASAVERIATSTAGWSATSARLQTTVVPTLVGHAAELITAASGDLSGKSFAESAQGKLQSATQAFARFLSAGAQTDAAQMDGDLKAAAATLADTVDMIDRCKTRRRRWWPNSLALPPPPAPSSRWPPRWQQTGKPWRGRARRSSPPVCSRRGRRRMPGSPASIR